MADYSNALSAHLDKCVEEGGSSFALTYDAKSGWSATGTKRHGRKEIVGTGDTAMLAAADFLLQIRGEPTEIPFNVEVTEDSGEIPPPPPRQKF